MFRFFHFTGTLDKMKPWNKSMRQHLKEKMQNMEQTMTQMRDKVEQLKVEEPRKTRADRTNYAQGTITKQMY